MMLNTLPPKPPAVAGGAAARLTATPADDGTTTAEQRNTLADLIAEAHGVGGRQTAPAAGLAPAWLTT